LISHTEGTHRADRRLLVGVRDAGWLVVFDLDLLLSGQTRPVVGFPAPWPERSWPGNWFTPGLEMAVVSGPDQIRGVRPKGDVRWHWRHPDAAWGADQDGSTFVTADGRQVWAVVPTVDERGTDGQRWVVLDASDGRLLDHVPLPWRAGGSWHLAFKLI